MHPSGMMTRNRARQRLNGTDNDQQADNGTNNDEQDDGPQPPITTTTTAAVQLHTPTLSTATAPMYYQTGSATLNNSTTAAQVLNDGQRDPRRQRQTYDIAALLATPHHLQVHDSDDEGDMQRTRPRPTVPHSAPGRTSTGITGAQANGIRAPPHVVNGIIPRAPSNNALATHLTTVRDFVSNNHQRPTTTAANGIPAMAVTTTTASGRAAAPTTTQQPTQNRTPDYRTPTGAGSREDAIFYRLMAREDPALYQQSRRFNSLLRLAERAYGAVEENIDVARGTYYSLMGQEDLQLFERQRDNLEEDINRLTRRAARYIDSMATWRKTIRELDDLDEEDAVKENSIYGRFCSLDGGCRDPIEVEVIVRRLSEEWLEGADQESRSITRAQMDTPVRPPPAAPRHNTTAAPQRNNDPALHAMRAEFDQMQFRDTPIAPRDRDQNTWRQQTPLQRDNFSSSIKDKLPTFPGDKLKWAEFEALMESELGQYYGGNPLKKALILRDHLTGQALKEVEHLDYSDENCYDLAMNTLRDMYDNDDDVSTMFLLEIASITQQDMEIADSKDLVLRLQGIVQRFIKKDRATATSNSTKFLLLGKLPRQLQKVVRRTETTRNRLMGVSELMDFLRKTVNMEIRDQELDTPVKPRSDNYSNGMQQRQFQPQQQHQQQRGHQPQQRFERNDQRRDYNQQQAPRQWNNPAPRHWNAPPATEGCPFCDSPAHSAEGCTVVTGGKERMNRLKERKRCFRCLARGAPPHIFPCSKICTICGKPHHFTLCFQATSATYNQGNRQQAPAPYNGQPRRQDAQWRGNNGISNNVNVNAAYFGPSEEDYDHAYEQKCEDHYEMECERQYQDYEDQQEGLQAAHAKP